MAKNILRVRNIRNEQTKNQNRFTVKFIGLEKLMSKAANSPNEAVRAKYNSLIDAAKSRMNYSSGQENVGILLNDTLELSLVSITLPDPMIETQDLQRFNDSSKATTKFTPMEDVSMTFYDYVNASSVAAFHIWKGLVGDKFSGSMGFRQDYILKNAEYITYGPEAPGYDEENLPSGYEEIPYLEKWRMANIYPKQIDIGEHSYENGEARRVTVTFSCDTIFPLYMGYYKEDENGNYIPSGGTPDSIAIENSYPKF